MNCASREEKHFSQPSCAQLVFPPRVFGAFRFIPIAENGSSLSVRLRLCGPESLCQPWRGVVSWAVGSKNEYFRVEILICHSHKR